MAAQKIDEKRLTLLFSHPTWVELSKTLSLEKFALSKDLIRATLEECVVPEAEVGQAYSGDLPHPCRDPTDDRFLALALGAKAEALVTGDKDLLILDGYYPFPILKPADFKARFFFDFMAGDAAVKNLPKKRRPKKA